MDGERTDALAVLGDLHRRIRLLSDEFEMLPPTAHVRKSQIVAELIDLVTVRGFIAREVFYPRVTLWMPEARSEVDRLHEQHRRAQGIAAELWTMRPEDERFTPRTGALIEQLRTHLGNEEDDWFPRIAARVPATELADIGAELLRARRRAPTSPDQNA